MLGKGKRPIMAAVFWFPGWSRLKVGHVLKLGSVGAAFQPSGEYPPDINIFGVLL